MILNVDGDVDRFACEYLHKMSEGLWTREWHREKNIGDPRNADCNRNEVSQAYVDTSYKILMQHKEVNAVHVQ